jgi:hypothetical protein
MSSVRLRDRGPVSVVNAGNPALPTDITMRLVPHQDVRSRQTVSGGGDAVVCAVTCKPTKPTATGGSFLVKLYSLHDLARGERGGTTYDVVLKTFCGSGATKVLSAQKTMTFVFTGNGSLDPKASHYAQ